MTDPIRNAYHRTKTRIVEEAAEAFRAAITDPQKFALYLEEAAHSNWEGYTAIEMRIIMTMFKDFYAATKDGRI